MGLFFLSTSPTLAISNLYSGILQSASHLLDSAQQDLTRCRFIRGHSEFCFCPHTALHCTPSFLPRSDAMRCDAMRWRSFLAVRTLVLASLPSLSLLPLVPLSSFFAPLLLSKFVRRALFLLSSLSSFLSLFFSRRVKYYVPPMINLWWAFVVNWLIA